MSVKSRVTKLESMLPLVYDRLPVSREYFDFRASLLKTSLERLGYWMTDEHVRAYALEYLKTRPGFGELAFDLADVGL